MAATLLVAAHGTVSADGAATTRALVDAVAERRPDLDVRLCFLDVARPSLAETLDVLHGDVVVVPLLLSAGYHVTTDIPAVVAGRAGVRVARHLGPDPLVIRALVERLAKSRDEHQRSATGPASAVTTALAAITSTRPDARAEVDAARVALARSLHRDVVLLPLGPGMEQALDALSGPLEIAVYLLAEGTFLDALRDAVEGRGTVANPIGVHDALVELVLARYAEANRAG